MEWQIILLALFIFLLSLQKVWKATKTFVKKCERNELGEKYTIKKVTYYFLLVPRIYKISPGEYTQSECVERKCGSTFGPSAHIFSCLYIFWAVCILICQWMLIFCSTLSRNSQETHFRIEHKHIQGTSTQTVAHNLHI